MSWLSSAHCIVGFSHLEGFQCLQNSSQDTAQNITYSLEEEIKVLDCLMTIISWSCLTDFPLFLYFPISLLKFIS